METPRRVHHFRPQEQIRMRQDLKNGQRIVTVRIGERQERFGFVLAVPRTLRRDVPQEFPPVRLPIPVEIDGVPEFRAPSALVLLYQDRLVLAG